MNRKRIPHAVSAEDAGRSTARAYLKMRFPALSDAHSVGKPQSSRSGLGKQTKTGPEEQSGPEIGD